MSYKIRRIARARDKRADMMLQEAILQSDLPPLHAETHRPTGTDPILPSDIGAETPAGAQTKADEAETRAKAYTDQQVSAHANRQDNPHNVTAEQVGAPTQETFDTHVANINNLIGTLQHQAAILKPEDGKLWHFDTSLESTDGIQPLSGAVYTLKPNEGKFGGAVAVEEGTTNLLPELSQFNTEDYAGRSETIIEDNQIISTCVKLDNTDTAFGAWSPEINIDSDTDYTFSFYVKSNGLKRLDNEEDNSKWRTNITWLDSKGNFISSDSIDLIELTNQWQRIIISAKSPSNAEKAIVRVGCDRPNFEYVGAEVRFKKLQLEAKPFATSFVDGTRAAGRLRYEPSILNKTHGTIAVWFKLHNLNVYYNALITTSTAPSPGPRLLIMREFESVHANKLRVWDGDGTTEDILTSTTVLQKDVWYHFAFTWSPSGRRLYINGSLEASNTRSVPIGGSDFRVGYWRDGLDFLNGLLDELLILPYAATEKEIKGWYEAKKPFIDQAAAEVVRARVDNLKTYIEANYQPMIAFHTAGRPLDVPVGFMGFDTDLGLPIWWNGTDWIDASGNIV